MFIIFAYTKQVINMRKVYVLKSDNGTVIALYGNKKALSKALVEVGFVGASYSAISKMDMEELSEIFFERINEYGGKRKSSVELFYLYTH